MRDFSSWWGCGRGVARSLEPSTRMAVGMVLILAALLLPLNSSAGLLVLTGAVVTWGFVCGIPVAMTGRLLVASIVLFGPFLLLTPWIATPERTLSFRLAHAGGIALRSTACIFLAASTVASIPFQQLHAGCARLPLPRGLTALILQLAVQTSILSVEARRIATSLRLRGSGGRGGVRALFSFPVVWMVRILFRAERTAAVMSLRGYGVECALRTDPVRLRSIDAASLIAAAIILVLSLALRAGVLR